MDVRTSDEMLSLLLGVRNEWAICTVNCRLTGGPNLRTVQVVGIEEPFVLPKKVYTKKVTLAKVCEDVMNLGDPLPPAADAMHLVNREQGNSDSCMKLLQAS